MWFHIVSSGRGWFVGCIGFNANLTAKVISRWSMTHMCFLAFSLQYQHNFSFQSHRLLFSHASAEMRGEYARKKVCLNPVLNSQPPGHEFWHAHYWATGVGGSGRGLMCLFLSQQFSDLIRAGVMITRHCNLITFLWHFCELIKVFSLILYFYWHFTWQSFSWRVPRKKHLLTP